MKRLYIVVCVLVMVCLLNGCVSRYSTPVLEKDPGSLSEDTRMEDSKKSSSNLVEANTDFAFDIFKQINKEDNDKNVFISPLSISTALSMAYQGAGSTTKEAMASALGYEKLETDKINNGYKDILKRLNNIDNKVELNIGNSVWIREGKKVEDRFLSVNKDTFDAYIKTLDFSRKDAANEINNWVSDSTKGKITKMINSPIPEDVLMYLFNAIYFKGDWTEPFDKSATKSSEFHLGEGTTKEVMMMKKTADLGYGEGQDFQVVRLPYGNGKVSMYCILPDKNVPVNSFINGMDVSKWSEIKKSISKEKDVILEIPRFKIEYGIKDLNSSLTALGMGEAFSDLADFSGIRSKRDVCISKVFHKAVIEVNEEGSEAAAVTGVEAVLTCAELPVDPKSFIADRPFVFLIADDESGSILFMGKLYDVME